MFIFGILAVPELNATFALICHQRYATSPVPQTYQHHGTPNLLGELKQCLGNKDAQSELSRFLLYRQVTAGLVSAISTPILGWLSDCIGRKPILASTVIGNLLFEAQMLLVLRYPDSINMHWLLVGCAMEGLSGSIITATSTSQTYITDLADPSDRPRLFSYLQAALSFAGALGPIVAGVLLAMPNPLELMFSFAVCAHLSLALIFVFVLPESRWSQSGGSADKDRSVQEQPSGESYVRVVLKSLKSLWPSSTSRQKNMVILAVMEITTHSVMMGLHSLQLAYPAFLFRWQPTTQSFYMSLLSSWSILVLVVIFPMVMARVRQRARRMNIVNLSAVFNFGEVGAIQANLILQMIGYIGIALSRVPSHFVISSLIVASTDSIIPLLTSCLTAHVPIYQSGQLLGVLSFLHAMARVVIPAALNTIYSMTIGFFPAPLFMLLAIVIGGLILASMHIKRNPM